ncbi:MAG: hypothetical protein LWX09_08545 [Bacteroidia bacterium]|jgi:hypothetical protein|nr:hypothetical protein [Bacteroidia bacterium]
MKFYDLDSVFTFGKYEGKTIKEVFERDPKYIDFCFNNIDEFYVSPEVMRELRAMNLAEITEPTSLESFDDEMLDAYLDDATEELDGFDESVLDDDEEPRWDDEEDYDLGFDDDDFESYDDYDDDDY